MSELHTQNAILITLMSLVYISQHPSQATTKVCDPATLAVLLEDDVACCGVVPAIGGIGMTHFTGNPIWDGAAGMGTSGLLFAICNSLAGVNHRFLIG